MFDNIGGKIKGLAKFVCWAGILACAIGGIAMIVQGSEINSYYSQPGTGLIVGGVVVMLLGSVLSWLGSLTLYGFGELIEQTVSNNARLTNIEFMLSNNTAVKSVSPAKTSEKRADTEKKRQVSQLGTKSEPNPVPKPVSKPVLTTSAQKKENLFDAKEFLSEMEQMDSVVDIWNAMRKYKLGSDFYDVEDYIRQNKDQEQLYGKPDNIEEIKSIIRDMLTE